MGNQRALRRVGLQPTTRIATPPSHPRVTRSTTLPSLYTSSPGIATTRPKPKPINASTSTTSTSSTTSKSKGVQMVSEMRARVRNLEQKIHTRVPRLRMGSITARHNPNPLTFVSPTSATASSLSNKPSATKTSWENFTYRRSGESARSNDSGSEKNQKGSRGDSSGWVLIMEDSPSPPKDREIRRALNSSPSRGSNSLRSPTSATLTSPTFTSPPSTLFAHSGAPTMGVRRPQSRLSVGSSTATTSSIPTPTSRPATPTFLPLPSTGLYAHSSTAGITGLKPPAGSGGPIPNNQKDRSSLGASMAISPLDSGRERTPAAPLRGTPLSSSRLNEHKALPQFSGLHANVTTRPIQAKFPPSATSTPGLAQSRIGRPAGRKSTDGIPGSKSETPTRVRSGSTVMLPS